MRNNCTYKNFSRQLLGLIILVFAFSFNASAQNLVLAANGGGADHGCVTTVGQGQWGPDVYIDGIIAPYGTTDPNLQNFAFVGSGGCIKLYKISPVPTPPGPIFFDFNKIVIYKDTRPMTTGAISYYDNNTQNYQLIHNYNNWTNNEVDSIIFAQSYNTDTILISNILGPQHNPSFREIQVYNLAQCSGTPAVTVVPAAGFIACFGSVVNLNASTATVSAGHGYQWQRNIGGTGWVNVPGGNSYGYSFTATYSAEYRVVDTCLNSNQFTASPPIAVTVNPPAYATVPYTQSFDNWQNGCATAPYANAVPGLPWVNTPIGGNNSWRRQNQGADALWNSPNNGMITPWAGALTGAARFHTANVIPFTPGHLDLFVNAGSLTGNKAIYFGYLNTALPGGDSLIVSLSTDSGATWTRLGAFDTSGIWRMKTVPLNTNANPAIVRFTATKYNSTDGSDIGIDSLSIVGPCSGTPTAGTIPITSPQTACAGSVFGLFPSGATMAGNLIYEWEQSSDGSTWSPVPINAGNGANNLNFVTPPLYDTVHYRLKVQCGTTGTPVYSNAVEFRVVAPQYASIPFLESFETWTNRCGTNDVPVDANNNIYWANSPATGNNSWRRNDQGNNANWTNPNTGQYWGPNTPQAVHLNRAARFHTSYTFTGMVGNMDLLADFSTHLGPKEVKFHLINPTGNDSLRVFYSDNGGGSFTKVAAYGATGGWNAYSVTVPSDAPNTVVRFQGVGEYGVSGTDIGLDSVRVIPPCAGAPVAGTITSANPCPGVNFSIEVQGTSIAAGLTYQWQSSPNGTTGWTNITSATTPFYSTNISSNTYYRVVVTCTNSGQADTTPVQLIAVANFWDCYCAGAAPVSTGSDIGNFTVQTMPALATHFSNGVATPQNNNPAATGTYSDFRNPNNPIVMYHDSTYRLVVRQINSGNFVPATVAIWIDTNKNGIFEVTERMMVEVTSNSTTPAQQVLDTITIPNTIPVGITGLRIQLENGGNPSPSPCGILTNPGEVEDYLVEIRYPPCDGPTNAGIAYVSDSLSCVGYTVMAFDTSHERYRSGINWVWEYSPDGNSWATVAGSQMKDTIEHVVTGPVYFRMRMICARSIIHYDTTYSNVVSVAINQPWACYCFSQSDGGLSDTADIGYFVLHGHLYSDTTQVGPHLWNSKAIRRRTDKTGLPVTNLKADSTYYYTIFHTQPNGFHADGKVTIFMDFNNDYMYSASERIFTDVTNAGNFVLTGSITIPHNVIINVRTGMRVIINNNTGPNIPSDLACGTYTSGETEDYVVMFVDPNSVDEISNIKGLSLYPNPTDGRFNVVYTSHRPVENAVITVSNVTGHRILQQQYQNTGTEFMTEVDLSQMARGVYFVELRADDERVIRRVVVK